MRIRNNTKKFITLYTVLFCVLFYFCFLYWCREYHKSIMCTYDGMNQHYLIFVYIGRWIRRIANSVFIDHQLTIPMFEIGIGYGGDVPTSLSAHLLDPFNWVAAFIPENHSGAAYTCVIIAKLYLAGISFAFLCRTREYNWKNTLIGALVYVFAASSYIFPLWAYFLNMLYLFPLIISGIDDLWKKKHSKLFLLSFFWLFINCFYFAYMVVILTVMYCTLKLFLERKQYRQIKDVVKIIGKFLINGVASAGLAFPALLPVLLLMSDSKRIGADFYRPFLYSVEYYKQWITGFTSSYMMSDRDCYIGYATIALVCVVTLFLQKQKYQRLKLEFAVLTVGMLLPAFGSMMNGFSYSANRWVFAYTLLIAMIVTVVLPELRELTGRQKAILTAVIVIYVGIIGFINEWRLVKETVVLLAVLLAFLFVSSRIAWRSYYIVITLFTMIGVCIPARYHFSENYENALRANTPRGEAYETVTNAGAMPLLREVGAEPEERFDGSNMGTIHNETMLYGLSGMNLYLSLGNNNISLFHKDIGLLTNAANSYYGLNRRTELENLMGVSRFLITTGEEYRLPYGYSEHELTDDSHGMDYSVYHVDRENSLLHAFSRTVSEEDWTSLDYLQRQEVLMQAVVTNDVPADTVVSDLALDQDELLCRTELRGVRRLGTNDYYTDGDGSIVLYPEDLETFGDGEVYICLEGTDYSAGDATTFSVNIYGCKDGERTEYSERLAGTNNKNHIYEGRHDWMINIGYVNSDNALDTVEINLANGGTYHFDHIRCYVRRTGELEESISGLRNVENDLSIAGNTIEGSLVADQNGHVMLSIPYSTGWKLWIDGEAAEIFRADDAFMMFAVSEGEHEVQMKYCTPGLIPGILAASFTAIVLIFWWRSAEKSRPYKR